MPKKNGDMTRAQLLHACRLQDAANRKQEADEAERENKKLARIFTTKGLSLFPWQLDEVKRHVHEAYGRLLLSKRR